MKKILIVLLSLALVLALAACSDGGGNPSSGGQSGKKALTLAEDTSMMAMTYPAPTGCESIERYTEQTPDGKLLEKDMVYNFADNGELTYAFVADVDLAASVDLSIMAVTQQDGVDIYTYESDSEYMALAQVDDAVYGIHYLPAAGAEDPFAGMLDGVSFGKAADTVGNDLDLGPISYTVDDTLPLDRIIINQEEDPAGRLIAKTVIWRFEQDDEDGFRFLIRLYKNTTVADVIDDTAEYGEATINGVAYSVIDADDEAPYEYFTQQGDDVYQIRNNGSSNAWYAIRSPESATAFAAFINSVSFE